MQFTKPMVETSTIYDRTATAFAARIDQLIDSGRYRRGNLFLSAALASVPSQGNILDYGCGPGRISALLARNGFRVRGIDPSAGMIAVAMQQNPAGLQLEFQCCQTIAGQPGGFFDAVVCSSVIEYVVDPGLLLGEFHRVLRPGGALMISFANSRSISRAFFQRRNLHLPDQKHLWNAREFNQLLMNNNFVPTHSPRYFESAFDRLPPLALLSYSQFVGTLGIVVAVSKKL